MKTCRKCGYEKPATEEFFRHETRARDPQLRAQCRRCDVDDQLRRIAAHPGMKAEGDTKYRCDHPDRHQARVLLHSAVRNGTMSRPSRCERCGLDHQIHGHHEDYTRPLDVKWLCSSCHVAHHRQIRLAAAGHS